MLDSRWRCDWSWIRETIRCKDALAKSEACGDMIKTARQPTFWGERARSQGDAMEDAYQTIDCPSSMMREGTVKLGAQDTLSEIMEKIDTVSWHRPSWHIQRCKVGRQEMMVNGHE